MINKENKNHVDKDIIISAEVKINWHFISLCLNLSEDFIREFQDKVYWPYISIYQKLSEDFIREFQDKVYWACISKHQNLSEEFIWEFQDKVEWYYISFDQTLSEDFIREFQDKVYWHFISEYQGLSEDFIREFQYKVEWQYISRHQKLSEDFIREFQDKVYWPYIARHQKLSKKFRKEFNISKPKNSWLYAMSKTKLKYLRENTNYEIVDDSYIVAYKAVRDDLTSVYDKRIKYEVGKEFEAHCDCNLNAKNSFGLSAWTKDEALKYYPKGKLLKVKVYIEDIGAVVRENKKIRCSKQSILEIVD